MHCAYCNKRILNCTCAAFVDIDGMEKCKNCETSWNVPDSVYWDCVMFVDIDGVEKCEKCKCKWDTPLSEIMSGKCESCGFDGNTCAAFIDIDGMERSWFRKNVNNCNFNSDW